MRIQPGTLTALSAFLLLLGVAGCGTVGTAASRTLTDRDRAAIRALDTAFVQAWLRDDTAAVLRLFHSDAILLPPGAEAVQGLSAIRAYWWPTDGSHTRIQSFTREILEIEGTPELAYFRGTAALGWVYQKRGKQTTQSSRSSDLVLVTPDSSGHWRILRQMWNQLP
jgi:uncharacterized protein (TIGR02246 family)